ncbi:hypothetical protein PTKIN_Ptkin19aG0023000 [Pterospermum kingtungense]
MSGCHFFVLTVIALVMGSMNVMDVERDEGNRVKQYGEWLRATPVGKNRGLLGRGGEHSASFSRASRQDDVSCGGSKAANSVCVFKVTCQPNEKVVEIVNQDKRQQSEPAETVNTPLHGNIGLEVHRNASLEKHGIVNADFVGGFNSVYIVDSVHGNAESFKTGQVSLRISEEHLADVPVVGMKGSLSKTKPGLRRMKVLRSGDRPTMLEEGTGSILSK